MPRLNDLPPPAPAPAPARKAAPKGQPRPAERFALHVADSPIDGLGVFAAEAIPARRKIGEIRGESISVREARQRAKGRARIHIVEISDTKAIDATESTDALRHMNHSCAPNALLRISQGRVEFYTLRDIAPGEELSCDYGESHHEGRLTCRCGAPHCKGRL
jgi:SET domain-containing protein